MEHEEIQKFLSQLKGKEVKRFIVVCETEEKGSVIASGNNAELIDMTNQISLAIIESIKEDLSHDQK